MIRYKEDKEHNAVWKENLWVSPNGRVHTESTYLGPYWGFIITCPDTAKVGETYKIEVVVVNWRGDKETAPEGTEVAVSIYYGETLLQEKIYPITTTITMEFTPEKTGPYLVVARQKGWNEGVCITTVE